MNNDAKVNEIAGKLLGKKGGEGYSSTYDKSLLVRVPRSLNREIYGIEEDKLPFKGFDVWNGYEVTALTSKGMPVTGVMKIVIPANTKYHPESKSIKMYINSFAMEVCGNTQEEVKKHLEDTVREDLSELLECNEIEVRLFTKDEDERSAENSMSYYTNLDDLDNIDSIEIKDYKMNSDLLEEDKDYQDGKYHYFYVKSNKLRSACRVTHQPDHGTIYISMYGKHIPTEESVLKFIISFRNEYHFHEEICEAVYKTLQDQFNPDNLIVACNYTRRGGWDINPIRGTCAANMPLEWRTVDNMLKKTIKQ